MTLKYMYFSIAVMLPCTHEVLMTYIACTLIGVVVLPLEYQFGMIEVEHMLEDMQPVAFVGFNLAKFPDRREYISELLKNVAASGKVPSLKTLVFLQDG